MSRSRRDFLKNTATFAGAATLSGAAIALGEPAPPSENPASATPAVGALATPPTTREGDMMYRTLGRTGEKVSLIGLGGFHIGKQKDEAESIKIIRSAIDRGITFMDNSWDYNQGQSEIRMGKALQDGYRKKVFLMTKVDGRTKDSARQQLNESLQRLQTDVIDLWQFHEVIRMEDPDRIFAKGGALEAALEAKQAGKIRYIGFTGHKDPLVHLRMLQVAGEHGFRFDTVQMPLNVMDWHFRSFSHQVLPVLVAEKYGVLNMKPLGDPFILHSKTVQPIEAMHFVMNLPTNVMITGIDNMPILDQAIEAARTWKPLSVEEFGAIEERTKNASAGGQFELYKTTSRFDSTAQHPDWLG